MLRSLSVKCWIKHNQLRSRVSAKAIFPMVWCRSEPSRWWNEHRRWSVDQVDTCAGPWAVHTSPFPFSSLCLSLPWFPPMVYYYAIIASMCLSSHRVDQNQEQKTTRARKRKEKKEWFFSPVQTIFFPPVPFILNSDQIKMPQGHFSLSVQDIII